MVSCAPPSKGPPSPPTSHVSRSHVYTLLVLGSVHFCSSVCVSLQAPFYPQEAELKGASATEYGLVFGVFELVSFVSSPVFGKYMDCIGAKLLLNSGIFLEAVCSILFGLLDLVDSHVPFISLSLLLRMVEAVGSSAAITAAFSITAAVFPHSVATTFATLEVFYGLGYIVGPTIGGLLFSVGGFMLPFVVTGVVLMVDGLLILLLLPGLRGGMAGLRATGQLLTIVRIPAVALDALYIMAAAVSMGFYSATLEPHIREFHLSPVLLGVMFVVSGGTYALSAPLVGRLCDRTVCPRRLLVVGSVAIITSYSMVGPLPFVEVTAELPLTVCGLVIHGLGLSCILVPGFIDAIKSATGGGLRDDISTYGLVSGLWASAFALGDFVGPTMGGLLMDTVGFRVGTLFVMGVHVLMMVSVLTFLCVGRPAPQSLPPSTPPPPEVTSPPHDLQSAPRKEVNGYGSVGSTVQVVTTVGENHVGMQVTCDL